MVSRAGARWKWVIANRYGISFCGDENTLELVVMVVQLHDCEKPLTHTLCIWKNIFNVIVDIIWFFVIWLLIHLANWGFANYSFKNITSSIKQGISLIILTNIYWPFTVQNVLCTLFHLILITALWDRYDSAIFKEIES